MINTIENSTHNTSENDAQNTNENAHQSNLGHTYQHKTRWGALLFLLCIPLILGSIGYYFYHSYQVHKLAAKAEQKSHKTIAERPTKQLGADSESVNIKPAEVPQVQTTPMPTNMTGTIPIGVVPNGAYQQQSPYVRSATAAIPKVVSRYDAAIMVVQSSVTQAGAIQPITIQPGSVTNPNNTALNNQGRSAPANSNGMQLMPTSTPKAKAVLLGDRNYVLAKGNELDCALNTAINSSNPGMVTCTATSNSYSDNGKVVLIERGSLLTGEYTGLKQGATRLAVLWDRIKTPTGVVIDLNSLGTDSLGRAGFDGDIDKHWMERIGAAFLLSSFKDLVAYEISKNGNSNGNTSAISIQNTQKSGDDLANQLLKQTINIAPTLTKNQGERVAIVVNRDLDFSDVYQLEVNKPLVAHQKDKP